MQTRSQQTIDRIETAAMALIAREGIGRLTMDAVAREAGVSKGGVLHHFRSKDALVAHLATRKLQSVRDGFAAESVKFEGQPAPALRGMVDHAALTYDQDDGFSRALLVAAVENSASLAEFRMLFQDGLAQVRHESGDPDLSTALLFAVIGLQISRTLGFAQLDTDAAAQLFERLQRVAITAGTSEADVAPSVASTD